MFSCNQLQYALNEAHVIIHLSKGSEVKLSNKCHQHESKARKQQNAQDNGWQNDVNTKLKY